MLASARREHPALRPGGQAHGWAAPAGRPCEALCVSFDCQTCGACCCNTNENRAQEYVDYVEVKPRTLLSRHPELLLRLTVLNHKGERHLKLKDAEQRCVALEGKLGKRVACAIYALRPQSCRIVKPGSKECLRDRRERGVR